MTASRTVSVRDGASRSIVTAITLTLLVGAAWGFGKLFALMPAAYVPNEAILGWAVCLSVARFANARFCQFFTAVHGRPRTIAIGIAGIIVYLAGIVGAVGAVAATLLHLYDFGWRRTVGILLMTGAYGGFIGTGALSMIRVALKGEELIWLVGTVMVYAAVIGLLSQFSWLGML
jgi:hypothetical protein